MACLEPNCARVVTLIKNAHETNTADGYAHLVQRLGCVDQTSLCSGHQKLVIDILKAPPENIEAQCRCAKNSNDISAMMIMAMTVDPSLKPIFEEFLIAIMMQQRKQ